jgi:hypothetical protein
MCQVGHELRMEAACKDLSFASITMLDQLRDMNIEAFKSNLFDVLRDGKITPCKHRQVKQLMDFSLQLRNVAEELMLALKRGSITNE